MNIYTAIMRAADTIENFPEKYNFHAIRVSDCNTPHCMVGWIGFHLGMTGMNVYADVLPAIGIASGGIAGLIPDYANDVKYGGDTCRDAHAAARALREAAKRWAPVKPQHTGLPDIVRDIFTNPRQTISDTAADQRFA